MKQLPLNEMIEKVLVDRLRIWITRLEEGDYTDIPYLIDDLKEAVDILKEPDILPGAGGVRCNT